MPPALSGSQTSCHCAGHSCCINDRRSEECLCQNLWQWKVEANWICWDWHVHKLSEELAVEIVRLCTIRSGKDSLQNIGSEEVSG